ncbi:MAG: sigma-54 dependent transcriptional regulator [Bacteroidetes bacterium]|nr:sigma-54 dependent transcriptional regulator [Bacteroidota bacterium]
MSNLSILILDDEKRVRDEISEYLRKNEFNIFLASCPSEAFAIMDQSTIDLAIVDIKLPEMDGLEVLKITKQKYPEIEVIMISGHGDMGSVIEAMRLGAIDYFPKPFRLIDINTSIQRSRRFIELNRQVSIYNNSISVLSKKLYQDNGSQMIGVSMAIKQVVELMERVSLTDNTSVLITGESGTGKELVALGIHHLSKRNKFLFHSVNCSAITDSLFESEFFGHRKGSFTGAIDDRQGWFETTNKGTLFLDEIGDMPMSQQAKLLRVLEERKVSRVGGNQSIQVDVRVIAASNQQLEKMADEKKFRSDLYHRLSTFIIHIPPLRERKEDIPLLIAHFIKVYAQSMGKKIEAVSREVSEMLQHYHFPGNIRELRNMIERAVILCDTRVLEPSHFPGFSPKKPQLIKTQAVVNLDLEQMERDMIERAMAMAENNKSKAASLLNISWQSLDRRLKKFGTEQD